MKRSTLWLLCLPLLTSAVALAENRHDNEGRSRLSEREVQDVPLPPMATAAPRSEEGRGGRGWQGRQAEPDRGQRGDHESRGDYGSRGGQDSRGEQRYDGDRRGATPPRVWNSPPAWNHDHDRHDDRWNRDQQRHDDRWNRSYGRNDWNRQQYYYNRYPSYNSYNYYGNRNRYYVQPRYNARRWGRGDWLPYAYYREDRWIRDYWRDDLYDPRDGCGWVRSDSDALLIVLATGLVLDTVYDLYR